MSKKKEGLEALAVERLSEVQRYMGEEAIENYQTGLLTRRMLLRRLVLICGSGASAAALLAACGDPTATTAPLPTTVPPTLVPTTAAPTAIPPSATAAPTTALPTRAPTTVVPTTAAASGKSPLIVLADDPAIEASEITYQSDTPIFAYLARPKAAGTYPGIIVIHEGAGPDAHIKDVTRRLAKAGYIALMSDLASRAGGTTKLSRDATVKALAEGKPEDFIKDLNAGIAFLEKQPGLKPDKFGVVGFCLGGLYTLQLAAANPKIAAAVPYYGIPPNPVSQMNATNAAILAHYGGDDARVTETAPALEKVLKDSGKTFEKRIYDGAKHQFNNDMAPGYNQTAALAAWKETLGWFDKYLKG